MSDNLQSESQAGRNGLHNPLPNQISNQISPDRPPTLSVIAFCYCIIDQLDKADAPLIPDAMQTV